MPFEIDVFRAKMQDSAAAAKRAVGGGSAGTRGTPLFVLLRRCQTYARTEVNEKDRKVWRSRVVKVGMWIVGSLVERKVSKLSFSRMAVFNRGLTILCSGEKEYVPALGMLDGLSLSLEDDNLFPHAKVQIQVVRFLIHLSLGTIHHAQTLLEEIKGDGSVSETVKRILVGLLQACRGRAYDKQQPLSTGEGGNDVRLDMVVANNEAVALVSNGELSEVRSNPISHSDLTHRR